MTKGLRTLETTSMIALVRPTGASGTESETPMATTLNARDFSSSTADKNRDTWTPGLLELVIDTLAAYGDAAVIIEVEKRTGHVVVGKLTGVTVTGACGGASAKLHVQDSTGRITHYSTFNIGTMIVPSDSKWKALKMHGAARSMAQTRAFNGDDAIAKPEAGEKMELRPVGHHQWDVSVQGGRGSFRHTRVNLPALVPA